MDIHGLSLCFLLFPARGLHAGGQFDESENLVSVAALPLAGQSAHSRHGKLIAALRQTAYPKSMRRAAKLTLELGITQARRWAATFGSIPS